MGSCPETFEERRKKALEELVREYFESKQREEELLRKLESYGLISRWLHLRIAGLRQTLVFVRDVVITPISICIFSISGFFSTILAVSIMPKAGPLIERSIPLPLNYIIVALLATFIVFSPFILSFEVYRHRVLKREKKILRDEYGIRV